MEEEDELRGSELANKGRETCGIDMIISEILCLFFYTYCPLFLLPLELRSQPQINFADTSIGVALHIITTDLEYGYLKVKFSEAS